MSPSIIQELHLGESWASTSLRRREILATRAPLTCDCAICLPRACRGRQSFLRARASNRDAGPGGEGGGALVIFFPPACLPVNNWPVGS